MSASREALVWKFGGAYGRLCALVAAALARGCVQDRILAASRGNGIEPARTYRELRRQRAKVNSVIALCKEAGITDDVLIERGRDSRTAVEQEFMLRIPRM